MGQSEYQELSQLYIANLYGNPMQFHSEFILYELLFADEISWTKTKTISDSPTINNEWFDLCRNSIYARFHTNESHVIGLNRHERNDIHKDSANTFSYQNSFVAPKSKLYKDEHLYHIILPEFTELTEISFFESDRNIKLITPYKRDSFISITILFIDYIELSLRFSVINQNRFNKVTPKKLKEICIKSYNKFDSLDIKMKRATEISDMIKKGTSVSSILYKMFTGTI